MVIKSPWFNYNLDIQLQLTHKCRIFQYLPNMKIYNSIYWVVMTFMCVNELFACYLKNLNNATFRLNDIYWVVMTFMCVNELFACYLKNINNVAFRLNDMTLYISLSWYVINKNREMHLNPVQ
jgi:hypothetical protein